MTSDSLWFNLFLIYCTSYFCPVSQKWPPAPETMSSDSLVVFQSKTETPSLFRNVPFFIPCEVVFWKFLHASTVSVHFGHWITDKLKVKKAAWTCQPTRLFSYLKTVNVWTILSQLNMSLGRLMSLIPGIYCTAVPLTFINRAEDYGWIFSECINVFSSNVIKVMSPHMYT